MLLRHARNGREPLGPKAEGIPCSTYRRSPGRLSPAGCVPAEPAPVSPAGHIVLFVSIIVKWLREPISGRDSLLLPPDEFWGRNTQYNDPAQRVILPGAGTGGKTCPRRAMMATSDTVRRFRLPVPGCRRCLYDRGPYSTPVAGCRFPLLLSLAAPNNTRPPRRTAKCCSASPVAVLFPGPRSLFPPSRSLPMCSRRS
jgi:hypothetical protein